MINANINRGTLTDGLLGLAIIMFTIWAEWMVVRFI